MSQECALCNKPVVSFVNVKEKKYHPECFKCNTCNSELAGKPFIEKDGAFFCQECFSENFGKTCAHCEQKITGPFIEALGQTWCPDHFVCSGCGGGFKDDQFRKHQDRPWCEDCYIKEVADTCGACGKPITGEMFEALGKKFHAECFVCVNGHPIGDGAQFYEVEGQINCKDCFADKLALKCSECQQNITGEYIMIANNKMHTKCWKCCSCKVELGKDSSNVGKVEDGQYQCKKCTSNGVVIPPATTTTTTTAPAAGGGDAVIAPTTSWPGTNVPLSQPKADAIRALENEKKIAVKEEDFVKADEIKTKMEQLSLNVKLESKDADVGPLMCYPISYLQERKSKSPVDFDYTNREKYLADDDFLKVFGMNKGRFYKLPAWRRKAKKQEVGLF